MFNYNWQDGYIPDLTLLTPDGPIAAYVCQGCHALTIEPIAHEGWHEGPYR